MWSNQQTVLVPFYVKDGAGNTIVSITESGIQVYDTAGNLVADLANAIGNSSLTISSTADKPLITLNDNGMQVYDSTGRLVANLSDITGSTTFSIYSGNGQPVAILSNTTALGGSVNGSPLVLGMEFYLTQPAYVTQINYYFNGTGIQMPSSVGIYSVINSTAGQLVVGPISTQGLISVQGWNAVNLPTPFFCPANTHFVVAELIPTGSHYGGDIVGTSDIVNQYTIVPGTSSGNAIVGNGLYIGAPSSTTELTNAIFPTTSSTNGTFYMVSVTVAQTAGLNTQLGTQGLSITDNNGNGIINIGTPGTSFLNIIDSNGDTVGIFDSGGNVTGQTGSFQNLVLPPAVQEGLGLPYFSTGVENLFSVPVTSLPNVNTDTQATAFCICLLPVTYVKGRTVKLSVSPLYAQQAVSTDTGFLSSAIVDYGTTKPTSVSASMTVLAYGADYMPDGHFRAIPVISQIIPMTDSNIHWIGWIVWASTTNGVNFAQVGQNIYMEVMDLGPTVPNTGYFNPFNYQGGSPSPPPPIIPPTKYTGTWDAAWSRSFQDITGAGSPYTNYGTETTHLYQGYYSSTHGLTASAFGFNSSTFQSDLSGASNITITLTLTNLHSYYAAGITAQLINISNLSLPATWSAVTYSGVNSYDFNPGQTLVIPLSSSIISGMANGTISGFGLYAGSDDLKYYGYFGGRSDSKPPYLTYTYYK